MLTRQKPAYPADKNKVLSGTLSPGTNFYYNDLMFSHFIEHNISAEAKQYMLPKWEKTGEMAAGIMNEWASLADKQSPQLERRNAVGEDVFNIRFHPAYQELLKVAVDSEMMRVKWEPGNRQKFTNELHTLGFASGYLFSLAEQGQYCPLCMTDGVARLIDRFCEEDDKERLLQHIYTNDVSEFFTGAMYLTEKTGGSDVGANIVTAVHEKDKLYRIYGEKWFCSNANADIIFALARTDPTVKGTKGLSIFLLEKNLPDGSRNPIEVLRIKDKLGVRSMASAECFLKGTYGKLVGEEFQGFKIMVEMINLSRLYNSLASVSASRRALAEAYNFLQKRKTFGKESLDHSLIRDKLFELTALHTINFYMAWKSIQSLDASDNGDAEATAFLRLLTPMVKKYTAETAVYITRESMELMGGMGYIEDGVVPRLMRDVMVLPIWEGSGNIMILDMLRATMKENALENHFKYINSQNLPEELLARLKTLEQQLPEIRQMQADEMQVAARSFFSELTSFVQYAILNEYGKDSQKAWFSGAKEFLHRKILGQNPLVLKDRKFIEEMIGWEIK